MNITEVFELQEWADRLTQLKSYGNERTKDENLKYYGGGHGILTDIDRQDVNVTIYAKDENGKKIENGAKTIFKTKKVLNYPVQLIGTLASFVFGNPPELILNNAEVPANVVAFQKIKQVWAKESRLDEHNKQLLRTVSVETNAAELFFNDNTDDPKNGKIKVMLLSKENGDDFWAFFNDNRDMEAFTRQYVKKIVEKGVVESKTYIEIWTADKYILIDNTTGTPGKPEKDEVNPYGKIPVIFYDQKKTEWWKVTNLVDIMEKKESQLSDVNTRVGHAAVKITGDLVNMPDASADVKVYQIKPSIGSDGKSISGDVAYLESQTAPASVELELKRTEGEIYKFSNIPDIYKIFEDAGKESSGEALRLRLFPINIIIDEKKEIYAPGLDRRVSLIKTMLYNIYGDQAYRDLDITVRFRDYIPEDIATIIGDLMTATGNKPVLSQKSAVKMLPLNQNPDEEYKLIQEDASNEMGSGSFGTGLNQPPVPGQNNLG